MSLTYRVRAVSIAALAGKAHEAILLSGEEKALTLEAITMFLALLPQAITDSAIVEETTNDVEKLRICIQTAPFLKTRRKPVRTFFAH